MRLGWLGLAIVVTLAGTAAAAPALTAYTRTHSGGGVEVTATYAPPEYFVLAKDAAGGRKYRPEAQIVFLLAFDTHAGDLTQFNVVRNIRLRTGADKEYRPVRWEATSDASHHRSGALIFPATMGGVRILRPGVTAITLVISNLAGVPRRTMKWTLPIR